MTAALHRDLAAKTRDLADDFLEAGYVEWPDLLRVIASIVDGDCPVHGRVLPAIPVTGVEVDAEPREEPHMWLGSPGFPACRCLLGQDHQQDPINERQD